MSNDAYFADNRRNWDDRVPIHAASSLYNLDGYVNDPSHLSSVVEFDVRYVGDVAGKTLLHPQCHIGTDTLSWARLGAAVTGIDFSGPAIATAADLATRMGIDARFIESDVYAAPAILDEQFDVVYTGVGAICWLPDIRRWAQTMATFTKPGGSFYMREGHPVMWSLDWERQGDELRIQLPYFERDTPETFEEAVTYAGEGTLASTTIHSWNHGIGQILTALLDVGFRIDRFEEHRFLEWSALPQMVERDGRWYLPDDERDLVPLMYSLLATKA